MTGCNQTPTLLLVDDDEINRIAFTRALGKLNHDLGFVTAEDGLEALEYLHERIARKNGVLPPAIVLLDVYMPRMNGAEFCNALAENPCFGDLTVYAFGTADMPVAIRSVLDAHIAGYLTKDSPLETLTSLPQLEAYIQIS